MRSLGIVFFMVVLDDLFMLLLASKNNLPLFRKKINMTLQIYSNYLDSLTHMDTLKGYVLKKIMCTGP